MKITILGSGGGEGYPALFCACDHCNAARLAGGKSIRTLSQTMINDDLLVDFPVDTATHARMQNVDFSAIENVLVTHTHSDHFIPQPSWMRGGPFAHNMKSPTLAFWGSCDVVRVGNTVDSAYGSEHTTVRDTVSYNEIKPYVSIKVGKYTVTPLNAKHAKNLIPYNYVISDGEKTLLYLLDTGYPEEDTLKFLSENFGVLDCVIMDATMGIMDGEYYGHMGFAENISLKSDLTSRRIADDKTTFVATHITHNKAETHDKIEQIYDGSDIIVAYDGICFEI